MGSPIGPLAVGSGEMLLVIAGLVAIWLVLGGLGFLGLRLDRLSGSRRLLTVPLGVALSVLVGFLVLIALVLLGILAKP